MNVHRARLEAFLRFVGRSPRPSATHLLVVILAAGLTARLVRYLLNFPLWGDEAFVAVNFLPRPDGAGPPTYADLFSPLLYGQIVPLAFSWAALTVTRLAGLSEYALRFVSLASDVAALALLWGALRWNFSRRTTLLAVAFLAAAYYPIRHACEVKPYSLDLLVATSLLAAGMALRARPASLPRWLLMILLVAVAPWCSYPATFVLGGVGLMLLAVAARRPSVLTIGGLVGVGVVSAASFLVMYFLYAHPHAEAAARIKLIDMWQQAFPPVGEPWKLPIWAILIHTGNMLAYPVGGKNGGSLITLVLVVAGAAALWRSRRRDLLLLLLGPLVFNFIAAAAEKYPYGGTVRTSMFMAPAFCLLAGLGLAALLHRYVAAPHRRGALRVAAAVFVVIAIGSAVRDLIEPFKKQANAEARRVVTALGQEVRPDDRFIIFNAIDPDVRYAPFIAPWRGDGAQLIYYLTRFVAAPLEWSPPPESLARRREDQTVWLLFYWGEEFRRKHEAYRREFAEYGATHAAIDQLWKDYLEAATSRLGPGEQRPHELERKRGIVTQQIDIIRFGPAPAGQGPQLEP